jgi:hypothetical protein
MWSCVLIFLHFTYLYGYLLDTNNSQQSSAGHNKQYIAVSEFIEEGYHQQRQLQRKFTLLASRLNLKLAALEQRINEKGRKKEICKENVQSQENELTKNYTELQDDFEILHEKYIAQNEELKLFRNKIYECDSEITSLIQLKTTQPLQDFHTLQKEVQSISKQIQALSLTRHARSEEIQSLYSETKGEIANLAAELQNFQSNQRLTLTDIERKMHLTIFSLDAKFEISEDRMNSSLTGLHQLVDINSERGILAQFDIYVFITNDRVCDIVFIFNYHTTHYYQRRNRHK